LAGTGTLRIIGGEARGRRLEAPRGGKTRPTADRVRESLFNVLGQRFAGERVLDLYAGSGALSLEALSRGASSAVLVESDREAAAVCERNAASLGYAARIELQRADLKSALPRMAGRTFDLVFVDPPYAAGPALALGLLDEYRLVAPGGTVVAEHDKREEPPAAFGALVRRDLRRFGDTAVSFYERPFEEPA
jgi:16S rRNA (guanine(966)-N(2))-methyltransferase RsmD